MIEIFSLFADCEKTLENIPSNVYESSVCGTEISDYLGNQRLSSNPQDYSNNKNFSPLSNGKCSVIYQFMFIDFKAQHKI